MSNLTPISTFSDVSQLEITDDVIAGAGGKANEQPQALLNRTEYLNDAIDDLDLVVTNQQTELDETMRSISNYTSFALTTSLPAMYLFSIPYPTGSQLYNNHDYKMNLEFRLTLRENSRQSCVKIEFNGFNSTRMKLVSNSVTYYSDSDNYPFDFYIIAKTREVSASEVYYDFFVEQKNITTNSTMIVFLEIKDSISSDSAVRLSDHVVLPTSGVQTPLAKISNVAAGLTNLLCALDIDLRIHYADHFTNIVSLTADFNETAETYNNDYIGMPDNDPIGMMKMFYGLEADIPAKWQACDGTNGTPDLRDKFVMGAGLTANGTAGGYNSITLTGSTTSINGNHTHTSSMGAPSTIVAADGGGQAAGNDHTHTLTIDSTGNHSHTTQEQTFNNRPSYIAIWYIMKISL